MAVNHQAVANAVATYFPDEMKPKRSSVSKKKKKAVSTDNRKILKVKG